MKCPVCKRKTQHRPGSRICILNKTYRERNEWTVVTNATLKRALKELGFPLEQDIVDLTYGNWDGFRVGFWAKKKHVNVANKHRLPAYTTQSKLDKIYETEYTITVTDGKDVYSFQKDTPHYTKKRKFLIGPNRFHPSTIYTIDGRRFGDLTVIIDPAYKQHIQEAFLPYRL